MFLNYRFENFSPYIDECTTRNIFKISFRLWEFSANVKFLEAKKRGRVDMRIQFFKGLMSLQTIYAATFIVTVKYVVLKTFSI